MTMTMKMKQFYLDTKTKTAHPSGGHTATFKDRVVTIQFECTRFNISSNMLVCVVSRYIVCCIIYLVILLT